VTRSSFIAPFSIGPFLALNLSSKFSAAARIEMSLRLKVLL